MRRLIRNAVKCLACGTTIESTHRHDYRTCGCPNGTMVDGGLSYQRWGAVDPSLVESLAEWTPENVEEPTPCKACGGKQTYTHADLTRVALCRWCDGTGISTPENMESPTNQEGNNG